MAEVVIEYVDRGVDRLAVHRYPERDATWPVVVLLPGMGIPAAYYRRFVSELQREGISVTAADWRGTGASTPSAGRTSRYGYADLTADVGAVLAALQSRLSGRRVVLLGHSLGGQLGAIRLATAEEPSVAGLALVACGIPYYKRFPHAGLAVLGVTQVIRGTSAALGYWPGTGFGGRQASGVIRDWAYTARTGRFPILAGADTDAAIAGMTTPVLAVSISRDRFAPVPVVDYTMSRFADEPVTRHHYTEAESGAPMDHFTWVRASGRLATRIRAFIESLP